MEAEFKELDAKNGWPQLYQQIRNESSHFEYTMKEAKKTENKNLNRYRDVSPYDHSRVKLQCSDWGGDYINASLLLVPDACRSYILTQGPLPNTTGHFWQMVWERQSKAVLMLNRVIEKNAVKCHQYWPLGACHDGSDVVDLPGVGLRVQYVSENEAAHYVLRRLKLTELKSGEYRTVLHFHYTTWPDFSVPQSPSAFLNFLFAVRESGSLDENVGPPVVHCSAGIGRSGTFCLVDSCLVLIERCRDANVVDVKKMLLDMRKYRMGLIQTPDQLRFSYQAILEGSKRVLASAAEMPVNNELSNNVSKRSSTDSEKDRNDALTETDDESELDDDDDDLDDTDVSEDADACLEPPSWSGSRANHDSNHRCRHPQGNQVPSLPPKRRRRCSSDGDGSREWSATGGCAEVDVACKRRSSTSPGVDSGPTKKGRDGDGTAEANNSGHCLTMKDGAVLTNFSERLREAELRKRQRKERNERMRDKIRCIQQKQQDAEKRRERRSLLKPISVSLLFLLGGGYLVYRFFWKG